MKLNSIRKVMLVAALVSAGIPYAMANPAALPQNVPMTKRAASIARTGPELLKQDPKWAQTLTKERRAGVPRTIGSANPVANAKPSKAKVMPVRMPRKH